MSRDIVDIDWAEIVDILASEYGWTIDYIKSLDFGQIISLIKAINKRYDKSKESDTTDDTNDDMSDFKLKLGGKERIRSDGRKEIII